MPSEKYKISREEDQLRLKIINEGIRKNLDFNITDSRVCYYLN